MTQVTMQNVKDIVPTTGMAGYCVLDKDLTDVDSPEYIIVSKANAESSNPRNILTGGEWTQEQPKVQIPIIMSRLTDVDGDEPGYFITANYINAIIASGAEPILIDYDQNPKELAEKYPGALLVGGFAEFSDKWYGKNPTSPYKNDDVGTERAKFEIQVLEAFMTARKPILGICNGMQVMAAAKGATLTGSIKESFPDAPNHCGADAAHPINIVPNTELAKTFGGEANQPIEMTSFHNEAVMEVPKDGEVVVNARSPEGIIEGIELKGGHPFTIGVQGHPEHYSAGIRKGAAKAIISAFVHECASQPA